MPVAIVYQPTPVFGGKAWTMPFLPVTPSCISFLYVGMKPGLGVLLHQIGPHAVRCEEHDLVDRPRVFLLQGAGRAGTQRHNQTRCCQTYKRGQSPTEAASHVALPLLTPSYLATYTAKSAGSNGLPLGMLLDAQ